MRQSLSAFLCASALTLMPYSANAHFQLIYTPELNLTKSGELPLDLIFWHPMENAQVLEMKKPQAFFSSFRGERQDLMPTLKEFQFQGRLNSASAFKGSIPLKRNGDYKVAVVPQPYYDESEDIYIQQVTKLVLNKGAFPTDWAEPLGLDTEILTLVKPYGAFKGGQFSGVVLSEGKPVPFIELEVEHITAEPGINENRVASDKSYSAKGGLIVATTDANGTFHFTFPKEGLWGFAALGSGPQKELNGKELSQDAVLWVQANTWED